LITAWREERPVEVTFNLTRPTGPAWRVSWNVVPTRDASGEIVGVLGTVSYGPPEPDTRILAELAHDLRTPLQALGMLSAILDVTSPIDAELQETLLKIRAAAGRALEVSRDLLDWCRNPTNRGRPVTATWFALEPFLVKLAGELSAEAKRKALILDVDVAATLDWEVCIDRVRLGRLLANLLSNAVRYTPRGRVEFTALWRGEGDTRVLALGVLDTGAGIGAEEQESIFEPFERGRAGKESDSGGSGLGLASVDNLLKELGLTLEVYSEHNRGSAFHLLLPLARLRRTRRDGQDSGTP
jgi:signal transduction histidine kinase